MASEKFKLDPAAEGQNMTRGLKDYLGSLHLTKEEIAGKKILDVGAGSGNFAKEAEKEGIESQIYSFDPLYGAELEEAVPNEYHREYIRHILKKSESPATKHRSVGGLGENLPFKEGSFDIVVAEFSLPFWSTSVREILRFISEALRVLKKGGELRIYPFDYLPEHKWYDVVQPKLEQLEENGFQIISDDSLLIIKKPIG